MRWISKRARGFTLVELMIAMALVGVLTTLIYGLFSRTSDSLADVEEMSATLDKARFALNTVRQDLESAGAQGTPNASVDPWVRPPLQGQSVHAVMVYANWDSNRDVYTEAGIPDGMAAANPGSAFSGFVVLGAIDYTQSFFAENLEAAALPVPGESQPASFTVMGNERGIGRLNAVDPFNVQEGDVPIQGDPARLEQNMRGRLLRIMDTQGYLQFSAIGNAVATGGALNTLRLTADEVFFRSSGEIAGLEAFTEDDVSLDLALLDAYWYRVRQDPLDATNLQLVRHRVDASELVAGTGTLNVTGLEGMVLGTVVLVDHVVDFRVWFDCVASDGDWVAPARQDGWDITGAGGTCLVPDRAASRPELLRMAHVRLSVRTPTENSNRPHYDLPEANILAGFETEDGPMVTYNVFPWARGSAGVVTLQTSLQLTNFAMRGLR